MANNLHPTPVKRNVKQCIAKTQIYTAIVAEIPSPCGLLVSVRGSYTRAPGSVPGAGNFFEVRSRNHFSQERYRNLHVTQTEFSNFSSS